MWPFLIGCLGTRLLLVLVAASVNTEHLKWLGRFAILPAIGFALIYIFGLRKSGMEAEVIWWDNIRPVHALLYGIFAFMATHGHPLAWVVLLLDWFVGLLAWSMHYYY
jgi:hypothetical protein